VVVVGLSSAVWAGGDPCVVPDNGGGTITLPPAGCEYLSPDEVHMIIYGLPPNTTIEFAPIHKDFICNKGVGQSVCSQPIPPGLCEQNDPNNPGGQLDCFESQLQGQLTGTGALAGYNRPIAVPVSCEVHSDPRTPFDPVQSFDTEMFRMFGQITGDPDFDLLRIVGGTDFGLPSPGHTTLTQLGGGNWAVDSFFDITYRIDFVGAPGGPLSGMSGSTTGTIRMVTGGNPNCAPNSTGTGCVPVTCPDGETCLPRCVRFTPNGPIVEDCDCRQTFECHVVQTATGPECQGNCPPGFSCQQTIIINPDGTDTMCCDCIPDTGVCEPTPDETACRQVTCPNPTAEICQPKCVNYNPATGQSRVRECACTNPNECHVVIPGIAGDPTRGSGNPCEVVDNGGGTITLPPAGCEYLSPDEVHMIIDGLPPGTTIEFAPIHKDFICHKQGVPGVCSQAIPPGLCEQNDPNNPGGQLDCFQSQLQGQLTGTGMLAGYNRPIFVPVSCEVHSDPRSPGNPVQSFDTDMYRMFGQITGDPDFDLLRIVGGTDFGLPSPGHTTLTALPGGHWAVDSFFDITYRIDFVGAPGGPLAGRSGSTTGTIRMATGSIPHCEGACPPGTVCNETRTTQADGTIDICCECVPEVCEPTPDEQACNPTPCQDGTSTCLPMCVNYLPGAGLTRVRVCDCINPNLCHVILPSPPVAGARGIPAECQVADNGSGSVDLPPPGCPYLSPDDVHMIIAGLPPGTTINLGAAHDKFIVRSRLPGGSLGGEIEVFDSFLFLDLQGTGTLAGYNRFLNMQIMCQAHTAPHGTGPVQSFDTDMFAMQGQLPPGDPDFDLLRITGGTSFGMPSPGHTTLTVLPGGNWNVDSFFDITYRIDFIGRPGGPLGGMSGSTTATIRMKTGVTLPTCEGACPVGTVCREIRTPLPDGSFDLCCECEPFTPPCICGELAAPPNNLVDLNDFSAFATCYGAPVPLPPACQCADLDADGDVDGVDFSTFATIFGLTPDGINPPNCLLVD
jgi:hypothetical protein